MKERLRRAVLAATVLTTVMCGPVGGPGPEVPAGMTVPGLPVPAQVSAENLDLALRRLEDLEADSEKRIKLRDAILEVLSARFEERMAAKNREAADEDFRTALMTQSTEEILAGEISPVVLSMARTTRDEFSPLGDEARVMVALLVLRFGEPENPAIQAEYDQLVGWTEDARQGLGDDAMRVDGLTDLYEQVAMVVPVPTVTDRLIDLYGERQALSMAAYEKMLSFQPSQGLEGLKKAAQAVQTYERLQPKVRMTSYLVARIFTRLGTPTAALSILDQGMDGTLKGSMQGQVHDEVLDVLEGLDQDPGSPTSWLALSRMLAAYGDTDLARWASRRGWRLDPWGPTFPLEIGRLYKAQDDLEGAREYMELALSLQPEKPVIYQELMGLHLQVVSRALEGGHPEDALAPIDELAELLEQYESRWPSKPSGLEGTDLHRLRGIAAYHMGQPQQAVEHLEKALAGGNEIRTIYYLAIIHARTLHLDKARKMIQRASKVHFKKHGEAYYWKTVLGTLDGDVLDMQGKRDQALKAHREALETGLEGLPFVPPELKPEMEARLGLLLVRLDRREAGQERLTRSVASGADEFTYTLVLSELTARGEAALSEVVTHYASTDSDLDPDTRLEFALWNVSLSMRAGVQPLDRYVNALASAAGKEWPGPLLGLAARTVDADEARQAAGDDPARLVALQYVLACMLLGEAKREEAIEMLGDALEAGRVSDPYHVMALSTLLSLDALPAK